MWPLWRCSFLPLNTLSVKVVHTSRCPSKLLIQLFYLILINNTWLFNRVNCKLLCPHRLPPSLHVLEIRNKQWESTCDWEQMQSVGVGIMNELERGRSIVSEAEVGTQPCKHKCKGYRLLWVWKALRPKRIRCGVDGCKWDWVHNL
jgi:hypothetical protein